jgi:hypothetical protein
MVATRTIDGSSRDSPLAYLLGASKYRKQCGMLLKA